MNERSLKVGFEGVGPARSAELVASLNAWLNEAVVTPYGGGAGPGAVQVELDQANPHAQSVATALVIAGITGKVLAAAAPIAGKSAEILLAHLVVETILRWWDRNGKPPMRVESENGSWQVITSDTDDPEHVLTLIVHAGSGPSS
jgi:hypothetical protein